MKEIDAIPLPENNLAGQLDNNSPVEHSTRDNKKGLKIYVATETSPQEMIIYNTDFKSLKMMRAVHLDAIRTFIANTMNISNADELLCGRTWSKLAVHMVNVVLRRICRTTQISDMIQTAPDETPYHKRFIISGLYTQNYEQNGMELLAVNPNAVLNKNNYVETDINCLITAESDYSTVNMYFHNLTADSQWFDFFFAKLELCAQRIMNKYFSKMKEYYVLEPRRNLTLSDHQVPPVFGSEELKLGETNIKRDKTCITYVAKDSQLRNLSVYLQNREPSTNLNVNRSQITQIWAKLSINFITDMLTKVFALTLRKNTHKLQFAENDYSRSFDVVGIYDVYRNRKQVHAFGQQGIYMRELRKTFASVHAPTATEFPKAFRAIIYIYLDQETGNLLNIELYNLLHERTAGDPKNQVVGHLRKQIDQTVDDMFKRLFSGYLILTENIDTP